MGGRVDPLSSAARDAGLLNWTEILRKAGLESPGYEEAVERTVQKWDEKQERKHRPKTRGKKGRGAFPSLKHGSD